MTPVLMLGACVDIPITAGKLGHAVSSLSCAQMQEVLYCLGGVSCLSSCFHILQGIGSEQTGVSLTIICPEA